MSLKIIAACSSDKYVSQCRLYTANVNISAPTAHKNICLEKERGIRYCTKGMMCKDIKAWTFVAGSLFINSWLPSYNFLIAATHIKVILIYNALAVLRKLCFMGPSCPTSSSSRYNKPKQTMKTSVFYLVQRAGTNKMEIATRGQISQGPGKELRNIVNKGEDIWLL